MTMGVEPSLYIEDIQTYFLTAVIQICLLVLFQQNHTIPLFFLSYNTIDITFMKFVWRDWYVVKGSAVWKLTRIKFFF